MAKDIADILRNALSLPVEARAALAESLLGSLEGDLDEDAEESWRTEIRKRTAELRLGEVQSIPWSEVRTRLLPHTER